MAHLSLGSWGLSPAIDEPNAGNGLFHKNKDCQPDGHRSDRTLGAEPVGAVPRYPRAPWRMQESIMTTLFRAILVSVAVAITGACGRSVPLDPGLALKSINDQDLARDVSVLASDKYEGREPGTRGEDLTVAFLERRFRELGLSPGNPDGTYVQRVPLIAVTSA